MKSTNLPSKAQPGPGLNPLVFTDINDVPDNPRLGLGYHQLYDHTTRVGLQAKLPVVSRIGDTITLYWDGTNVQQYDLDQATIDRGWLSFGVSPDTIFDPVGEVYYTLFDHSVGEPEVSDTRTIAVNRRVPGGLDPDIGTGINDALPLCTVSPNPVTDPNAPVTVSVPQWVYQELGDELTVMWNNIRVNHPPLTVLGAQNVTIPKEVLEAGGSSDNLKVDYEIRDIVDNYSLVSRPTYVTVEIDPNALHAARVEEADRTTLILDLEALGDNDAHVRIPAYTGNYQGYEVTLAWVGKTAEADISLNLPPQRVEEPDFDFARFAIPNEHMKQIAGGSAVLRYTLVQDGVPEEKKSKSTTITITGLPVQLAPPMVDEANGTTVIDLANVTGPDVTVRIAAYGGQAAGDKVLLNWKGTPASGGPVNYTDEYEIKSGQETQPILFKVLRDNLDPLANGRLDISYQVIFSATGSTKNSPVTQYTVKGAAVGPVAGDESFERQQLGPLQPGIRLPFANGLFITVTGASQDTAIIIPSLPQFGNRALYCPSGHKLKFEFGGEITYFLLSHAITASLSHELEFFNKEGVRVENRYLQTVPPNGVIHENYALVAPCVSCELTVDVDNVGTVLDNLVWM